MGRLVETLAPEQGFEVAGAVDEPNAPGGLAGGRRRDRLFSRGRGARDRGAAGAPADPDRDRDDRLAGSTKRRSARPPRRGIGVVAAPNFAIGVNVFLAVVERLGALMAAQPSFGAWIHESHHAAKRDAPSGTALAMEQRLRGSGYTADVPIASTRAGAIPGTHTLGFDAASETITLTHQARDRAAFAQRRAARGALAGGPRRAGFR